MSDSGSYKEKGIELADYVPPVTKGAEDSEYPAYHSDSGKESDLHEEERFEALPTVKKSTSTSMGVRKAEIMADQYKSPYLRVFFFVTTFCVAYCYGLDGTIRYTFQSYATSSYAEHSLLSTVNVIRSVIAAASQPVYARLCDKFGRLQLFVMAILFYAVGTVIESQAYDVQRFAGGAVIYQIGYSGVMIILQIMLADFSNLNWRLVASFIPALPFIINTWISGNVASELYPTHSWNYSIGIFAFIFPLACIPYLACLTHMLILARRTEEWAELTKDEDPTWASWKNNCVVNFFRWNHLKTLFWELDVIAILLIIVIFGCILVPFTLAGGVSETWKEAHIIVPLVVGFAVLPLLYVWEAKFSRFPVIPIDLVKDRGVWSALFIGLMIDWVWYMPNDFMYTVLVVGMNQSIKAATRITSLYSFVSVITGPLLGFVIVFFRRTKVFIIFGVSCWCVALGLLVHFRGDNDGINAAKYVNGVIGGLCLMGFGAGFFTYTTQVSIEACTNHENMAIIMSLYLSSYNIGLAFGSSVSGAVWTNTLYKQIVKNFEANNLNVTEAATAYSQPFTFILTSTWETPERQAVVKSYAHTQKILCIVGLVLCFPLLLAAFFLRDHRLESVQSLDMTADHHDDGVKRNGVVVLNNNDDDIILNKLKSLFGKK